MGKENWKPFGGAKSCYQCGGVEKILDVCSRDKTRRVLHDCFRIVCGVAVVSRSVANRQFFRRARKITKKATVSIAMSVCLSVCPSACNSAPTGRIFMSFDIWVFFENLSIKFKFH